jgi:hypothetical protein
LSQRQTAKPNPGASEELTTRLQQMVLEKWVHVSYD